MAELTDKQERFCLEYVVDSNGTQAAIRAGYSEKTANEQASRLLAKVNIKARIEELQAKTIKKLEITREDILRRLNSRSLLMEEIQILASKETLTEAEEDRLQRLSFVIRASDANKSDEMIAKMLGFNEPDKLDINVKDFKANFGT